jgi:hypothetical protein
VSLDYIIGGAHSNAKIEFSVTPDTREILSLFQHMSQEQRKKSITLINDLIRQEKRADGSV